MHVCSKWICSFSVENYDEHLSVSAYFRYTTTPDIYHEIRVTFDIRRSLANFARTFHKSGKFMSFVTAHSFIRKSSQHVKGTQCTESFNVRDIFGINKKAQQVHIMMCLGCFRTYSSIV